MTRPGGSPALLGSATVASEQTHPLSLARPNRWRSGLAVPGQTGVAAALRGRVIAAPHRGRDDARGRHHDASEDGITS